MLEGAELIFNLSASNELVGKNDYVRNLVVGQSARCHCAYIYASSGYGESTQDVVFGGKAFIAENGHLLTEAQPFATESQPRLSQKLTLTFCAVNDKPIPPSHNAQAVSRRILLTMYENWSKGR